MSPSPVYDALQPQIPMQSVKHPAPPVTMDVDERSNKRMKWAHEGEGASPQQQQQQQNTSETIDIPRQALGEQQGSNGVGLDLPGIGGNGARPNQQQQQQQQQPTGGVGPPRVSQPQLSLPGGGAPSPRPTMGPPSSSASLGNPSIPNTNAFRPSPSPTPTGSSMRPATPQGQQTPQPQPTGSGVGQGQGQSQGQVQGQGQGQGQGQMQGQLGQASTPNSAFSRRPSMSGQATPAGSSGFRTPVSGAQTPVGGGQPLPPPSNVKEGKAKDSFGSGSAGGSGGGGGGAGVDSLQDLMGMTGVDLRAEEEAIQKRGSLAQSSAATATVAHGHGQAITQRANVPRSLPFYLEIFPLSHHIHKIAARFGLGVEPEVLTYISIATRIRFRNLLESMITASRHRNWSSHLRPPPMYDDETSGGESSSRPMYDEEMHDDPMKLLAALAKVEKAEEARARQARHEREERKAARTEGGEAEGQENGANGTKAGAAEGTGGGGSGGSGGGAGDGGDESGKKKGTKKPGAAATARNMTEDKRLKLANKTAAQALGFGNTGKAWMFSGASASSSPSQAGGAGGKLNGNAGPGGKALPKPRFAPVAENQQQATSASSPSSSSAASWSSSKLAPGSSVAGTSSSLASPGGWGDLAARKKAQEEKELQARLSVTLEDALFSLEMERAGGAGRGSGESVLYKTRALGNRAFSPPKNPPS